MASDPVLRVGKIAEVLQCANRTVAKLVDSGELPGYKLPGGRHRRVPLKSVLEFITRNKLPEEFADEFRRLAGVENQRSEQLENAA